MLWFSSEPKQELGAPAPWSVKLAGNVIDPPTWCGAATTLCAGTWRPPSFVENLLSGTRGQGDRGCVHRRDLVASSNTLRECYNNVDVGVPLWLTEPRDKHPRQEFVIFYPTL